MTASSATAPSDQEKLWPCLVGFVWWAMTMFDGCKFALCGKTIEALRRNVVSLLPQWMEGICEMQERRSDNTLLVRGLGTPTSFMNSAARTRAAIPLIQGMTLAGVLFDEVALMPRSFVEQAMARCSVGRLPVLVQLQPESPGHWFYTEWGSRLSGGICSTCISRWRTIWRFRPKFESAMEGLYSGCFMTAISAGCGWRRRA